MANDLSVFTPEIWYPGIVQKFRRRNLALALIASQPYDIERLRSQGDTVHVRSTGTLEARSYSRHGTVEYQDVAPTEETLVVDQADYVAFAVDDLDRVQNDIDAVAAYTTEVGVTLAEKMDTFAFSFHNSAHDSNKISNGGSAINISTTAGATHPYNILVDAGVRLDQQNVPRVGRWAIITPYMHSLLLLDQTYLIKGSDLGDAILQTAMIRSSDGGGMRGLSVGEAAEAGYVGRAAGFDLFVSNILPGDGSGNYYALYGQGRPLAMVVALQAMEALRLEITFGTGIRALTLYGAKVFNEMKKAFGRVYVDNS
jgi:hypothetical protein